MNTPVSFEIAKLLKEKGFSEPTLLCYDKCDMLACYAENIFKPKNYNTSGYIKSAPTIIEVIVWLYEKHGIWIGVDQDDDETFVCVARGKSQVAVFDNYNSPTEAYEAAIEFTLKNLI